jgi:hypothetical protein
MDELPREYVETQDKKSVQELYELSRELENLGKESKSPSFLCLRTWKIFVEPFFAQLQTIIFGGFSRSKSGTFKMSDLND